MENQSRGKAAKKPLLNQGRIFNVPLELERFLHVNKPWCEVKNDLLNITETYVLMSMLIDKPEYKDKDEYIPPFEYRMEDMCLLFDLLKNT